MAWIINIQFILTSRKKNAMEYTVYKVKKVINNAQKKLNITMLCHNMENTVF